MRYWGILAVIAALTACASLDESARREAFETVTRSYARAMQWSDYASVAVFVPEGTAFNPESYRDFKVTSYQPSASQVSADGRTVRRSAVISYVRISRMAEQSVQAQEEWVYAEDHKRWYLQRGLPVFK